MKQSDFLEVAGVWAGAARLLNIQPSWQEVAVRVAEYRLSEVLETVGRIGAVLRNGDTFDIGTHLRICAGLVGPEYAERIGARLALMRYRDGVDDPGFTPRYYLFGERPLRAIVQVAVWESICDGTQARRPSDFTRLAEALWIVNDLIALTPSEPTSADLQTPDGIRRWLYFFWLSTEAGGHPAVHSIAWTIDLYLTDRIELRGSSDYLDLPALFREATGLDADAYAMATLMFLGTLFAIDVTNVSDRSVGFNPDSFRGEHLRFSDEQIDAFFSLAGQGGREFLVDARREYSKDALEPYYHLPVERAPLVRFEKEAIAVSLRALEERLTGSIYHTLFNARPGAANKAFRDQFMRYVGVVFEEVALAAISRMVERGASGRSNRRGRSRVRTAIVLRQTALQGAMRGTMLEGGPVCDCIVVEGNTVLLIECKAKKLAVAARGGRDQEQFFERLDEVVVDAARQLDGAFRAFSLGMFASMGADPARCIRVVPVVISLQDFHPTPLFYRYVEESAAHHGYLRTEICREVELREIEVLSQSDLDLLEMAIERSSHTLSDLLEMKRSSSIGRHQSVWNWGLVKRPVPGLGPDSRLIHHARTYERLGEAALEFFRAHSDRGLD